MTKDNVQIGSEDTTCTVYCECGEMPFVSDSFIYRCKCGRGYRTEFVIFDYAIGETDGKFKDSPPINTDEWKERHNTLFARSGA